MAGIPLVNSNSVNDINTSIIAIKKEISSTGNTDVNVTVNLPENSIPVDTVADGDMHAVTSNAVAEALSLLDNKKLEWTINEGGVLGQLYPLDNLPDGVYLTFSTSLWNSYAIICINLVFKYNGNYFLDKIYDPNNYISIQGSNLKTNLLGFYTLKMLSIGY